MHKYVKSNLLTVQWSRIEQDEKWEVCSYALWMSGLIVVRDVFSHNAPSIITLRSRMQWICEVETHFVVKNNTFMLLMKNVIRRLYNSSTVCVPTALVYICDVMSLWIYVSYHLLPSCCMNMSVFRYECQYKLLTSLWISQQICQGDVWFVSYYFQRV